MTSQSAQIKLVEKVKTIMTKDLGESSWIRAKQAIINSPIKQCGKQQRCYLIHDGFKLRKANAKVFKRI